MKNMKISTKLIVCFLIVAVLAAIVGATGIYGLSRLKQRDTAMYEKNLLAISAINKFNECTLSERMLLRVMVLTLDSSDDVVQDTVKSLQTIEQTVRETLVAYESTVVDPEMEGAYYLAKKTYFDVYLGARQEIIDAALAGDHALAEQRLYEVSQVVQPIYDGIAQCVILNERWASETQEGNAALANVLIIIQVCVLIIAVAVALFFAFGISGIVSKPVRFVEELLTRVGTRGELGFSDEEYEQTEKFAKSQDEIGKSINLLLVTIRRFAEVEAALTKVAGGDLTAELALLSEGDTMGRSLKKMVDNLNDMFSEIIAASSQVSTGSHQIADGAQLLAHGSTEQAAAVEELSATIFEISNKTRENAAMADKAANLAGTIKQNAEKGSRQMEQMMAAVREINDASKSISRVIKVIDDIAFQTNILALNAAVEAARAGQHGKGFAVVAEEVRSLAAKSAEAAKDTGGLIANSMEKAALGARIANDTAASLAEIVSGINESNQIVIDIAKSSEEQSNGILQVNTGIEQVAQVVAQNSATSEQAAAASEEMSGQSSMLEALVSQFKLKETARYMGIATHYSLQDNTRAVPPKTTEFSGDYGKY